MITKFKLFEGNYVNKFDFEIGKSYEYNELPKKVRNDIDLQFEDYAEYCPEDYKYLFKLLTPEETSEYLEGVFGEWDIGEAMDHPYIKKLIRSIKEKGLDYPAVGVEGNHRALAFYVMNKPLPFLEMVLKPERDLYNEEE
jgi:hypothetical protein